MKNIKWKASKFEFRKNEWRPSNNPEELAINSIFIASIQLKHYKKAITKYAKGRLLDLGSGKAPLYGIYKSYIEDLVCADWAESYHQNDFIDTQFDLNHDFPLEPDSFNTILGRMYLSI